MNIKNTIISIAFILCGSALAYGQNKVFDKISNNKDVKTVHVSQSLLEMISELDTSIANVAPLADKLKQIDIYSSKTSEGAQFMKSQASYFETDKSYQTFMTVKEQGETIIFYGQKNGSKFKDLIMVINESSSCTIMRFIGEFTTQDIQKVIKK